MADRWNLGRPDIGAGFDPGFVSPWNDSVRGGFGDLDRIATIPTSRIPESFAGEMDGDAQTTFSGRGKKRGRR
jgi:hypothetical protein